MSGAFPGKQQRLLSAWGLLGGGVRAGVDGGCTHPSPRPPPTTGGVFFPPHGGSAAKPVVNSHGKRVSFVRSASYPVPPPTPSRLAAIPAQRLADSGPVRPRLGERFHPPVQRRPTTPAVRGIAARRAADTEGRCVTPDQTNRPEASARLRPAYSAACRLPRSPPRLRCRRWRPPPCSPSRRLPPRSPPRSTSMASWSALSSRSPTAPGSFPPCCRPA